MKLARVLPVAALCLSLLPAAAFSRMKSEEIENPTIQLNTKATPAQVKKAVKMAVLNRQWQISGEKPNEFDATYTRDRRNEHLMAKIHVTYSTKEVSIRYLASEGLSAEGNQIHPTYNNWIGNLKKDIPIYVEREVVAGE